MDFLLVDDELRTDTKNVMQTAPLFPHQLKPEDLFRLTSDRQSSKSLPSFLEQFL